MNASKNLQELLDDALVVQGLTSGRRLAEVAQAAGFVLTHTTVNAIRSGAYKSRPSEETLRAIAWLAGVSEAEAFTAAGLPVPGPPLADELPPGVDQLTAKARRVVIELLRVLVDTEAGGEHVRSAPITHAWESQAPHNPEDSTYEAAFQGVFKNVIKTKSADLRQVLVLGLAEDRLDDALLEALEPILADVHQITRGIVYEETPPERSRHLRAAREGTVDNPPDGTTGEESQDPGTDDPA